MMDNKSTAELLAEYIAELESVKERIRAFKPNPDDPLSYRQIKVLKSMKKDLQYSISLMKKHQ